MKSITSSLLLHPFVSSCLRGWQLIMQNKPNFKIGNINISTAKTKAYAKEQRTMNTKRYPKQTQSNPIPPPRLAGMAHFFTFLKKIKFFN